MRAYFKFSAFAAAAALALAGCATSGAPGAVAPKGQFNPTGPIALGAYEQDGESKIVADFAHEIEGRYVAGAPMAAVLKDLNDNKFACAAPKAAGGAPPDQVCKRVIKAGACNFTYQVHLFDDDGGKATVGRVRGLYDKTCGEDLLGG